MRDLLLNSFERDGRVLLNIALKQNESDWLVSEAEQNRFNELEQKEIKRLTRLSYQHDLHLLKMLDEADEPIAVEIKKSRNCLVAGVQLKLPVNASIFELNTCKNIICPYCFGRKSLDLYDRLALGLNSADINDGLLVLLNVNITDEDLPYQLQGSPLKDRISYLNKSVRPQLVTTAEDLGIIGGVTAFQVGPMQFTDHTDFTNPIKKNGFEFHLSLLGETREPNQLLEDILSNYADQGDTRLLTQEMDLYQTLCNEVHPKITVADINNPLSLRVLFSGHSYDERREVDAIGQHSLLHWPSWVLSDYDQWSEHLHAMKGKKLFRFFGLWADRKIIPGQDVIRKRKRKKRKQRNAAALPRYKEQVRQKQHESNQARALWMGYFRQHGRQLGETAFLKLLHENNFPNTTLAISRKHVKRFKATVRRERNNATT